MSVPPLHPFDLADAMDDQAAAGRHYIRRHRLVEDSPEPTITSAGAVAMLAIIIFVLVCF